MVNTEKLVVQLTVAELDAKLYHAAVSADKRREPSKYVNSNEACVILGKIHKNTLRHHYQAGDFPAYRRGRDLMFKRQELYNFLESNRIG